MRLPLPRPPPLGARSFLSFSPFSAASNSPTQSYHEQRKLPYSARQLYRVVSDVQSYHKFVPFCVGSRILRRPQDVKPDERYEMDAELTVGFLAFKESYVSRVTCEPFQSVEAVASSSTPLFKSLTNLWRFQPVLSATRPTSEQNISSVDIPETLVTLELKYAFSNPLHAQVSSAFFGQVSKATIKAFEDRCFELYAQTAR